MGASTEITVSEYRQLVIDYLRDTSCWFRKWGYLKEAETFDSAATLINALPAKHEEADKYRAKAEARRKKKRRSTKKTPL